jgi:enoyl-CoA hydratase/carnithine racemase
LVGRPSELRVLILRGAGRALSAEQTSRTFRADRPGARAAIADSTRRRLGRLLDMIQNTQAVTIAQVHGAAVGGDVLLMAACDLRIVATGTVMFMP